MYGFNMLLQVTRVLSHFENEAPTLSVPPEVGLIKVSYRCDVQRLSQ